MLVPVNVFLLYFPILVVLVQLIYLDVQGDDTLVPRAQPRLAVIDLIVDVISAEQTVVLAHGVAGCPLPVCCLESVPTLELSWRDQSTSLAAPLLPSPPHTTGSQTSLQTAGLPQLFASLSENLREEKKHRKIVQKEFYHLHKYRYHDWESTTQFGKNINPTATA